ncbi:MAG: SEC-C metal-binding domain-containing protein [Limnothrix sp.]
MQGKIRKESDIFAELAEVCTSQGYVHAIAYLCFRDNTIKYADTMNSNDLLQQFYKNRLIRTEISTLIGLACKKSLDISLPSSKVLEKYVKKTDSSLQEIHQSMMPPIADIFNQDTNPFQSGSVLRESIFYAGESAYHFQYRDLSKIKYQKDNDWFLINKGFSIQQVIDVVSSVQLLQNSKMTEVARSCIKNGSNQCNFLSAFIFTAEEVSESSNITLDTVRSIIESFVSPVDMGVFKSLSDFNPTNAYPIIRIDKDNYLLFQIYSLMEALYETPFFWFNDDRKYCPVAMRHRGEFTEEFSAERLKLVFGESRVFLNIDIYQSKTKVGEIDVLVIFADRAIVLQAKSKKLTVTSRKGNDNSLQQDFKKAVQDAYDQAYSCATYLDDENYRLISQSGDELDINRDYREIYPLCITSEHYPALSFQVRQFLKFQETENIKPPFVMDVFLLDVMTEMLQSPLYFLSYIGKRTACEEKILSNHELTVLAYHLKENLWVDSEYTTMYLEDDICAELDLAMRSRRDDFPSLKTPRGILTKYKNTIFDQIIKDLDDLENPNIIDLGFLLLSLSGDTIEMINDGIYQLLKSGKKDGKHHDLTFVISDERGGLTIHCNNDHQSISGPRLEWHCELRKYSYKAKRWFGICIGQAIPKLRFGVNKEYDWVESDQMDQLVKDLPKSQNLKGRKSIDFSTKTKKMKRVGRNEKCPCGSGKKYKKCCLKPSWKI